MSRETIEETIGFILMAVAMAVVGLVFNWIMNLPAVRGEHEVNRQPVSINKKCNCCELID